MNRAELIDALAERAETTKADAGRLLDALNDTITATLKAGSEVTLGEVGKFKTSQRAARTGRNPQTGATIQIRARRAPVFKAGKALKDALQ